MAKSNQGRNPFKPGPATKPGYLAGRDQELRVIKNALDAITEPQDKKTGRMEDSPFAPIKIAGPRGVGKTTLVKEARLMAEKRGVHVVLIGRFKKLDTDSPLYVNLVAGMKEKGAQAELKELLERVKEMKLGPLGVSWNSDKQNLLLMQVLQSFVTKQPLALLVDEAMECDSELLGELLYMCQDMINYQHPMMLILAGTPNLNRNLAEIRANFTDCTKDLDINALAPEATREALCNPFEKRGVKVRYEALELMAGMTDDYPFFIQIVGHEVWEAMVAAGRDQIDKEIVSQAEKSIQQERNKSYSKTYERMDELDLLEHARQVMDLLHKNEGRASREMVMNRLMQGFNDNVRQQARDVFHALVDRGFIWEKEGEMEPGIPSFFTYFEKRQQGQV